MSWSTVRRVGLATLVASLAVGLRAQPAEACVVKSINARVHVPKKHVAHSANPSNVLLVGALKQRLRRQLSDAGHHVDTASSVADAKRTSYAVVVTDAAHLAEARESFPSAAVFVRTGDVAVDLSTVEKQVARRPLQAATMARPSTARVRREPVDARRMPKDRRIAAAPRGEATPVTETAAPATTTTATAPAITTAAPTATETARRAPVAKPASVTRKADELYFPYGATRIREDARLARVARWLASTSVAVVIEGHADPRGSAASNLALAQARAEAVRDYLVAAGIDPARLDVVSYGETRLKYGRSDARNRRVVVQPRR